MGTAIISVCATILVIGFLILAFCAGIDCGRYWMAKEAHSRGYGKFTPINGKKNWTFEWLKTD